MAVDIGTLRGYIELDDELTPALESVSARLDRFGGQFEKFGRSFTQAGQALTVGVTLPLVALAAGALKAGVGFETAMNRVEAAMQPTEKEMSSLRKAAQDMGAATVFSSTEAAEALTELGKAGFDSGKAVGALPSVLQLAVAGQMSMADASTLASNTMKTFGLRVEDMGHANDVLAKAANLSTIEVGDLSEAMKYVGPVAKVAGVSLETVSASMALLGEAGIRGSMAGTTLRNVITTLMSPTAKQAGLMKELGLSAAFAGGKLASLPEIIAILERQSGKSAEMLELFGDRAGPGMVSLVEKGSGALRDLTQALKDSDGYAQRASDTMMKGLPGALERAKGSIETAFTALNKSLAPAFIAVANAAESAANFVTNRLMPAFDALPVPLKVATIALLGLAAALGPALIAIGAVANGFGAIMRAVGTVTALFTADTIAVSANTAANAKNATARTLNAAAVAEQATALKFAAGEQLGLNFGVIAARDEFGKFTPRIWQAEQALLPFSGALEQTAVAAAKASPAAGLFAAALTGIGEVAGTVGAALLSWPALLGAVAAALVLGKDGLSALGSMAVSTGSIIASFARDSLTLLKDALSATVSAGSDFMAWMEKVNPLTQIQNAAIAALRQGLTELAGAFREVARAAGEGDWLTIAGRLQNLLPPEMVLSLVLLARSHRDAAAAAAEQAAAEASLQEASFKANRALVDLKNQNIEAGKQFYATWSTFDALGGAMTRAGAAAMAHAGKIHELTDAEKQHAEAVKKAQAEIAASLGGAAALPDRVKDLVLQYDALGNSSDKIALALGVSSASVKVFLENVGNAKAVAAKWDDALEDIAKSARDLQRHVNDRVAKGQQEVADAGTKAYADQLRAAVDYQEKNRQLGLAGTALRLRQIDAEQEAFERATGGRGRMLSETLQQSDAYYDHLRRKATGTADTIVERMREAGVATRADLAESARAAQRDYEQMRDAVDAYTGRAVFGAAEISAAFVKANRSAAAFKGQSAAAMQSLAGQMQQLAQIAGDTFAPALRGVGEVASSLARAQQSNIDWTGDAGKGFGIANAMFNENATHAERWASALETAGQVAAGAMSVWEAASAKGSKAANTMNAALQGAAAGAAFGPWGAFIGGIGGAITGLIRSLSAGRRAVIEFMDSFDTAAAGTGSDELRRKLLALGEIGERLWVNLTQRVKKGDTKGAQQAIDAITDALARADQGLAKFVEGARKRLDSFFKSFKVEEIKKLQDALALEMPEIEIGVDERKLRDELKKAQGAVADALGGDPLEWQKEYSRMGLYAGAAFAQAVKEKGWQQAIADAGPLFDQLDQVGAQFGLTLDGSAAKFADFYKTVKANEDVMASLDGLTMMIRGAGDAAFLDQELMSAFSQDAIGAFTRLTERGVDANTALVMMQPTLQALWEAEQKLGVTADAATQKLIDQAVQQGIVGEDMRDVNQQILDVLKAIGKALGADIPAGARTAGAALDTAFKGKSYDVPVRIHTEGEIDIDTVTGGRTVDVATGGYISDRANVLQFAAGGAVRQPDYLATGRVLDFRPRGSDTQAALLTPGEMVLTGRHQRNLEAALEGYPRPVEQNVSEQTDVEGDVHFHRGAFEGMVVDSDARVEQLTDRIIDTIGRGGRRRRRARAALKVG